MNWTIALLCVVLAQGLRLSNYRNSKKGTINEWLIQNADEIIIAFISCIVLMLVLMNESILAWIDAKFLGGISLPTDALEAVISLVIGLSNVSIIRAIMSITKKKLKNDNKSG